LNGSQEDAATGAIIVVEVELCLQAEVEEIRLGEVEDVISI
jgi:hypothetical protein